jgi:cbb3-type cytochrome oxidase subunit 3
MQRQLAIASASALLGGIFVCQVWWLYRLKTRAEHEKKKEEQTKKFMDDSIARRRIAVLSIFISFYFGVNR